jgi:hypothetical protein
LAVVVENISVAWVLLVGRACSMHGSKKIEGEAASLSRRFHLSYVQLVVEKLRDSSAGKHALLSIATS